MHKLIVCYEQLNTTKENTTKNSLLVMKIVVRRETQYLKYFCMVTALA